MKTLRPVLALALITTLLASCSTSNDVVGGIFQKRKYNKGFYWNQKSHTPHDKGSDVAKKYETENTEGSGIRYENSVNTVERRTAEVEKNNSQPLEYNKVAVSERASSKVNSASEQVASTPNNEDKSGTKFSKNVPGSKNAAAIKYAKKKAAENKSQNGTNSGKDDVEIVLLVILAIFIPWLAVLLYEGATTRFWIVLLLWLLGFFSFFFIFGGLFFLAAFIYALLIVLGVV